MPSLGKITPLSNGPRFICMYSSPPASHFHFHSLAKRRRWRRHPVWAQVELRTEQSGRWFSGRCFFPLPLPPLPSVGSAPRPRRRADLALLPFPSFLYHSRVLWMERAGVVDGRTRGGDFHLPRAERGSARARSQRPPQQMEKVRKKCLTAAPPYISGGEGKARPRVGTGRS